MDVVALGLKAGVIQVVAAALKTRYAGPFQNGWFFHRGIRRLLFLRAVGEEVIGNCDGCRVKACAPIRRVSICVVGRVAVFVARCFRG